MTPGELVTQCQLRHSGKYEWRKVADAKYGQVTIQDCKANTRPLKPVCHKEHRLATVKYQELYIYKDIKIYTIELTSNWEVLYRKPGTCPDGKGGLECSEVCSEIIPKKRPVEIEKCIDTVGKVWKTTKRPYWVKVCEPPKNPPHPDCRTTVKQVMIEPPRYARVPVMEKGCIAIAQ